MSDQSNCDLGESNCVVRFPEPGDYGRMADLAGQLDYPCTGGQIQQRLGEMQHPREYAVYVAELSKGQIAGWIAVCVFRSVEIDKYAEISGLIVDQESRSRGIGKVLLNAAEEWARTHDCGGISVHSNVTRKRAHE